MSATVHPISENPRLRIRHLVETLVERQQAAALEKLRVSLPLDDPDRHALGTVADAVFARFADGPKDGAA
jgi:hypothetical protein